MILSETSECWHTYVETIFGFRIIEWVKTFIFVDVVIGTGYANIFVVINHVRLSRKQSITCRAGAHRCVYRSLGLLAYSSILFYSAVVSLKPSSWPRQLERAADWSEFAIDFYSCSTKEDASQCEEYAYKDGSFMSEKVSVNFEQKGHTRYVTRLDRRWQQENRARQIPLVDVCCEPSLLRRSNRSSFLIIQ